MFELVLEKGDKIISQKVITHKPIFSDFFARFGILPYQGGSQMEEEETQVIGTFG